MTASRIVLVATALLGAGCAGPLAHLRQSGSAPMDGVAVTLREPEGSTQTALLLEALTRATPAVRRWGGLQQPVTLHVVPDHPRFERALGRHEPSLKAWARYDEILLESPAAWGADAERLALLLAHELTHCVTFQRLGGRDDWQRRPLPFWFREGLATVTAGQGVELPTLEELAGWLRTKDEHVFDDAEALARTEYRGAYGLAHQTLTFLLRRAGDGAVPQILAAMAQGATFDAAFQLATGSAREDFERDARNYIRLRGFRGYGLPLKPFPNRRSK